MKRIFWAALAMALIQAACGTDNRTPADPSPNRANRMKIRLKVEGTDLTATLGKIDSGVEALNVPGSVKVTVERVGKP